MAKLFEEIKIMFQDLPSRIEKNASSEGNKRIRKMHPMMFEEMLHFAKDGNTGFLMVLSFFRNEIPWIYDLGVDVLKNIKATESKKEKENLIRNFERVIESSTHNPYFEEMIMRNKEDFRIYLELPHMPGRALRRIIEKENSKELL